MRLRREGAPVEALAKGLRGLAVRISDESLRLWLNQELGHKPARRRKLRQAGPAIAPVEAEPVVPAAAVPAPVSEPAPSIAAAPAPTTVRKGRILGAHVPVMEGTSLILPGETPWEAYLRRTAPLRAADAAANAAKNEAAGQQVVRDNI